MVSFFGLKLGGDRKKSQSKASDKTKDQEQWGRIDQNTLGQGQYFGHNFSRPNLPSSRPGTSSSTHKSTNWRHTFMRNAGATSSMVDLAAPPKGAGMTNLRQPASDNNLRTRFGNESSNSLALPPSIGGFGPRPGASDRPSTSGGKPREWVNPLDVHFGKETGGRPRTPLEEVKSPLAQFQFGIGHDEDDDSIDEEKTHINAGIGNLSGYPSPPPSIKNDDRALSPASPISPRHSPEEEGRRQPTGPSNLRTAVEIGPRPLPSPAASVPRSSEDRADGPIIRNVKAKRDTSTFHQPLRRSCTMELDDEAQKERNKKREIERAKHQTTQLFTGNFSAFDFGSCSSRPVATTPTESPKTVKAPSLSVKEEEPAETAEPSKTRNTSTPELPTQQQESPLQSQRIPTPPTQNHPGTLGSPPKLTTEAPRRSMGAPLAAAGAHRGTVLGTFGKPPSSFGSRMGTESRSRAPPKSLQTTAPPRLADREHVVQSPRSPFTSTPVEDGNPTPAKEGALKRPEKTASPLPSSPFSRQSKMEGNFPISKGLPRGRRLEPPPRPARPDESPSPVREPQAKQPETKEDIALPGWDSDRFDSADRHRSAIPPPLVTKDTLGKSTSKQSMEDASKGASTPTSAIAPRLPSPTFESQDASKSFDISFDDFSFDNPLMSPVLGEFQFPAPERGLGSINPKRVDAKKAPPRPAPITLPPSPSKDNPVKPGETVVKSPILSPTLGRKPGQFEHGFI